MAQGSSTLNSAKDSVTIGAALPAGANNIGDVDVLTLPALPAGTNNIGDVDVLSLPALPAGTNNIGDVDVLTVNGQAPAFGTGTRSASTQRVTIATDDVVPASQSGTWTVQPGNTANTTAWLVDARGNIAHGSADSGNPVKVGGRIETATSTATMEADGDRADFITDADSAQIVRLNYPLGDLVHERVTNTDGASTAFSNFGAVASTKSVITAIVVHNSSATAGTVDFRDGTGGSVLWTMPLPAGGGSVLCDSSGIFKTSANTALAYDVSAALSTVTISISGFKTKT